MSEEDSTTTGTLVCPLCGEPVEFTLALSRYVDPLTSGPRLEKYPVTSASPALTSHILDAHRDHLEEK